MDEDTALLLEIRDLVREVRDLAAAHGTAPSARGTAPVALRARTALALGLGKTQIRAHPLQPYGVQIAAWIDAGHSQQQILGLLAAQGVPTTKSSLSRFVRSRLRLVEMGET